MARINWSQDPRDWFKKTVAKPEGVVGLSMTDAGVAIGHSIQVDGQWMIKECEFAAISADNHLQFVKEWVAKRQLQNADCHCVLHEDEYDLQLLEAPAVEEQELREAVIWRLKDLINIPIEEAAVDIFPLPDDAYRGRMNMLYAVATEKSRIQSILALTKAAALDLKIIDIEEMALRNIALYLEEMDHGTVALLQLRENQGSMFMYSHESLYLNRQIEMGYSSFVVVPGEISLDNRVMVERLALDLQRSLDYYESQLGKGVTSKIYILPMEDENVHFEDDLKNSLHTPLVHFDSREHLPYMEGAGLNIHDQAYGLAMIGSLLRRGA
jgi:MSHA biogenesis protein MshI